eukprot:gnl/TRDRNA2_/TRDRNA2_31595_c0_seq1.p3 gnl/TRDRNA2_/TRDRNA2_31595_c0~~gnl/TRDRNA2_/TRDRNA2_31595_c0_seq1.p3  ORF type:complete len:140 (+),score=36.88 gnl/TRDRNA2_/TRDRNA2_31595_c0_seq1:568-987(+)
MSGAASLCVDTEAVDDETWWTIGEDDDSVHARMGTLLQQLYKHAEECGSEEGDATVFVGHAQVLCRLFRRHLSAELAATELGSSLRAKPLANCAVLKMKLARSANEGPEASPVVIHAAEFLFDTGFVSADFDTANKCTP